MISLSTPEPARQTLPSLKISADGRRIATESGQPFFFLADVAWELFHRADRADAETYLADRAAKGFNVIQAAVLAEMDGLRVPNAYGDLPLLDLDPERPNESYFEHVDWIIKRAASFGLYTAALPAWGDKWNRKAGIGPEVFTPANAEVFGEWLGARYRDQPVIWVLGGDRNPETEYHYAVLRAMADGLRRGDGGAHLITYHPSGNADSATFFHGEDWLDFNSRRNSDGASPLPGRRMREHAVRLPQKPLVDLEPIHEDVPFGRRVENPIYSNAADARRAFYWSVFSGACGHSYGHNSIWQFHEEGHAPMFAPIMDWKEALLQPGAYHMGIGRRLMESRPMEQAVSDESILVPSAVSPGNGDSRQVALRDAGRTWAMIYIPDGRACDARLDCIAGASVKVWRYDPRTGTAVSLGMYPANGSQRFAPPVRGERLDWILIFDDPSRGWDAPGAQAKLR